jgi:hypothetical protein
MESSIFYFLQCVLCVKEEFDAGKQGSDFTATALGRVTIRLKDLLRRNANIKIDTDDDIVQWHKFILSKDCLKLRTAYGTQATSDTDHIPP